MHPSFRLMWIAALTCGAGPSASFAQLAYELRTVNPTGGVYDWNTSSGVFRDAFSPRMNAGGDVAGRIARYWGAGDDLGYDAWFYRNGVTSIINLTGGAYETDIGATSPYRSSDVRALNDLGQVTGISLRYRPDGSASGQDAWLYANGVTTAINLTGAGYQFTRSDGSVQRSGNAITLNAAGDIAGHSSRYSSTGGSLGTDVWIRRANGTYALAGLTGADYEITTANGAIHTHNVAQMDQTGRTTGISYRPVSIADVRGYDAWVFDGNTTSQINLTGGEYEYTPAAGGKKFRQGLPVAIAANGDVVGTSQRYTSTGGELGKDAWIYHNGTTTALGLRGTIYEGTQTIRSSDALRPNAAGDIAGTSGRYNGGASVGTDAWIRTNGQTRMIGLTGADYENQRFAGWVPERLGTAHVLMESGNVVGSTARGRTAVSSNLGRDTWIYDAAADETRLINPTGPDYEYSVTGQTESAMFRDSTFLFANGRGDVVGTANRYNATGAGRGRVSWFYDAQTGVTTPLIFSQAANGTALTFAQDVTEQGLVVGAYVLEDGAANAERAFSWSASNGFHDLGGLVQGGLSGSDWKSLSSALTAEGTFADGLSPQFIMGVGQTSEQVGGFSVILLTAVPEPASAGVLIIGLSAMLTRRR